MSDEIEMARTEKTTTLCKILWNSYHLEGVRRILVVGCGDGCEAAILAQFFNAEVTGIDIQDNFCPRVKETVNLLVMDATNLDYPDQHFDLVYSFHSLEHIQNYQRALREMCRVLKKSAPYCVGTPNRSRLVGYIGSSVSIGTKIKWNLADYRMRFTGRFRNEYGAHAGFTSNELLAACVTYFGDATDISGSYYRQLYSRYERLLGFFAATRMTRLIFPCVYVTGLRNF